MAQVNLEHGFAEGRGDRSIQARLLLLALAIFLPGLAFTAILAFQYARAEQRVIQAERADVVRNAQELIDREIGGIEAQLRVLAASPVLKTGDRAGFYALARAMVSQSNVDGIALVDGEGRQLLATTYDYGAPAPAGTVEKSSLEPVFSTGKSYVSDVLNGLTVPGLIVVISAPVFDNVEVRYALRAAISVKRLPDMLSQAGLREGWIAGIVDRAGRFIARNVNQAETLGREARPELVRIAQSGDTAGTFENTTLEGVPVSNAFRRSSVTGWTVVIAVPTQLLNAPLYSAAWAAGGFGLALFACGLALARHFGSGISRPLQRVHQTALSLLNGQHPRLGPLGIKELNQVALAFDRLSELMRDKELAEKRIAESERRFRGLAENMPHLVWETGPNGWNIYQSPGWYEYVGAGPGSSFGEDWLNFYHPEDREYLLKEWRQALQSGGQYKYDVEVRIRRADGAYRWFRVKGAPVKNDAGVVERWAGTCTDIDENKRLRERQELLARELAHRIKNIIAVVHALARQTFRQAEELSEFMELFERRLASLARAQDLLIRSGSTASSLRKLIEDQLLFEESAAPHQFRLSGEDVELSATTTVTLGLILHELGTNSRKYGALATPEGKVSLIWQVAHESGTKYLNLHWVESGGTECASGEKQGFGSVLIKNLLATTGGNGELRFGPQGFLCDLRLALTE